MRSSIDCLADDGVDADMESTAQRENHQTVLSFEQRISKIELPTIFPLDQMCVYDFPTRPNLVSHSTWVCVFFANNAPSTGHVRQCVSEHRWLQHGAFHEVLWINR